MKIKKIVVSTLLISSLGLGIFACKKEVFANAIDSESKDAVVTSMNKSLKNGVVTDGQLLIFTSIADFDNLSDAPEFMSQLQEENFFKNFTFNVNSLVYPKFKKTVQYESWISTGIQNNYPSLLLDMLNADGAVQIGKFIYRLDFVNNFAYVISVANKNAAYNDLITGNVLNKMVLKFNWEQEVVDVMENRVIKEDNAPKKVEVANFTDKAGLSILLNGNWQNQTAQVTIAGKHFSSILKARYRTTPIFRDFYCKLLLKETTNQLSADTEGNVSASHEVNLANVLVRLSWQRSYKIKNRALHGYHLGTKAGTGKAVGQSYQGGRSLSKYIMGANAEIFVNGSWQFMNFPKGSMVNGTAYQVKINRGF